MTAEREPAGSATLSPALAGALARYRVLAYIVGVVLLVLVLVGVPLKYFAHAPTTVSIVGPLHGFLFLVYIGLASDLARRCRWPFERTLLVLLAGTVPFLTFVAERRVTRFVQAEGDARRRRPAGQRPGS